MATLGSLAQQFRDVVVEAQPVLATGTPADVAARRCAVAATTASLMTQNFATRIALYGERAVGPTNMRMVAIARELGAAAKLPGSGGMCA
jgi:hypothetical protein